MIDKEHISSPEQKEQIPYNILGKISIMRHGATEYTEQYPDLTDLGAEQITIQAKKLKEKIDQEKEDVFIASSPAARARGSADIVRTELGGRETRVMRSMRGVQIRNREEAMRMIQEIIGPDKDVKKMDRAYAHDPQFEERVDVWEPRSNIEKRFFNGFEHLVRVFNKYNETNSQKIAHFVGVSHFELLNHLVKRVFHLDSPEADQLNFGEMIEMTVLGAREEHHIPILITFRGKTKEIVFDRNTKAIEITKED